MEVIKYEGIVADVIAEINTAYEAGEIPDVRIIRLTREEMDEFIKNQNFDKNIGQFYGDADVVTMRNIEAVKKDDKEYVLSFYLAGIQVVAPPPIPEP